MPKPTKSIATVVQITPKPGGREEEEGMAPEASRRSGNLKAS